MTDTTNEPDPKPSEERPAEPAAEATEPAPRARFRDRMFGVRSVAAVTLASLVLGGLGGAAIAAVVDDDGPQHRGPGQMQMRDGGRPDHGTRMPPGGMVPPATPPEDEAEPETETPSDSGTAENS
jgi:hypothetical protein